MRKLILGTGMGLPLSIEEQIPLIKRAGFDGLFLDCCDAQKIASYASLARAEGLLVQSVHAPFGHVNLMWEGTDEEAEGEIAAQIQCLEACARAEIPLVVMHAYIGFERHDPTELGAMRYDRLYTAAERLGVKIAMENTEGEEYLEYLFRAFPDRKSVGFCIDTGHEMCYNESRDLIGKYGYRLFSTHLNDNLRRTGDVITWHDDSHLLPFDGKGDWEGIARRLHLAGYEGPLTFELTTKNKPNRSTHDIYAHLSPSEYLTLAHAHAVRFGELFDSLS